MADGISPAQALDLLKTTLNKMEVGKFTSSLKYGSYPLCEMLFSKSKIPVGGPESFEVHIRVAANESAGGVRMYGTRSYRQTNVMRRLAFPYVMGSFNWIIDVSEMARNRSGQKLVDLITVRRDAAFEDWANYLERRGMLPPDSAADDLNPQGLLFHIRGLLTGSADTVGGFNGYRAYYGDGAYVDTVGGVDASIASNVRLRNWAFTHDGVFSMDLVRQLRRAARFTNRRAPQGMKVRANDPRKAKILWPTRMADDYSDAVNAGPDDRNGNISPFFGDLQFGPFDTVGCEVLDERSDVPILGVDFNAIEVGAMPGRWMVEDEPLRDIDQPGVFVTNVDSEYNFINRRPMSNFIGHVVR